MTIQLQQIIGVSKKNPYFTICRNESTPRNIYVYFGAALMEVVPEDKSNPEFKLLIARLYNAGVKAKSITEEFGTARTTMSRWGDALKSGDPECLVAALSGQGSPSKLTPDIVSFIKARFPQIYNETRYNYSAIMRKEIKEIFGKDISSETLRPVFKELKEIILVSKKNDGFDEEAKENHIPEEMAQSDSNRKEESEKRANKCDLEDLIEPNNEQELFEANYEQGRCNGQIIASEGKMGEDNPKDSLVFCSEYMAFCFHVGVLIFSNEINGFDEYINNELSKQFLLTVLLGTKNIEQTKLLDFNSVKAMLGMSISNLHTQRTTLSEMSTEDNVKELLKYNAQIVNANQYSDFYYDPHVTDYTGAGKILKGWCPAIRGASKIVNMDFIHTADGHPVYVETTDNFYDLRERFMKEVKEFRDILECDDKIMTFIVDRGIYSFKVFETIVHDKCMHIATWEKGYKKDKWDDEKKSGKFSIYRARNNSHDLFKYDFEYIEQDWDKKDKVRQLIVRATNPKRNTIEVAILTDDMTRRPEETIELMFSRWVQENDFKYSEKHFGINEITSYSKISFKKIKGLIEDKKIKRGEYKAYEKEAETIRRKLKNVLYKERTIISDKRRSELKSGINELTKELERVNERKLTIEKEGSKIEELIENGYLRLNLSNKKYMDCIKIIARNIFYKALEPFKEKYDNYRDDHVIFRNLSQAHGVVSFNDDNVDVTIFPTGHLQPKVRKIVEEIFHQINNKETKLPDGSGRKVYLKLGKKMANALFEIKVN